MEGQDSFIMRELEDAEVDFGEDGEDAVADVGNNADLYLYAASQSAGEYLHLQLQATGTGTGARFDQ